MSILHSEVGILRMDKHHSKRYIKHNYAVPTSPKPGWNSQCQVLIGNVVYAPAVENMIRDIAPPKENHIQKRCQIPHEESIEFNARNFCFLTLWADRINFLLDYFVILIGMEVLLRKIYRGVVILVWQVLLRVIILVPLNFTAVLCWLRYPRVKYQLL